MLQFYIGPEKIKSALSSKHGRGYVNPALMVFLFSSPLLNPILIVLFAVTFGVKIAAIYFAMSMGISIMAGIALEMLGFEKYIITPEEAADKGASCGTHTTSNKWKKMARGVERLQTSLSIALSGRVPGCYYSWVCAYRLYCSLYWSQQPIGHSVCCCHRRPPFIPVPLL